MASPVGPSSVFRFGPFELDAASSELCRNGIPIRLHPQPFRVLLLLAERPGQIVTREEIRQCLWGSHTFVDFDRGINFCVNQIRVALADDADSPRYVETIPRRGYRFIGPRTVIPITKHAPFALASASETSIAIERPKIAPTLSTVPSGIERRAIRKNMMLPIAALAAIAILAAGLLLHFRSSPKMSAKDTIVVADFTNTTGDPVFDDALKEGLAVQLSQSPFLNILSEQKVRETLQFMGRAPDERLTPAVAQEVGRRTGSNIYVTGSISKLGRQYVVALNATNCQTGDSLGREQVTAEGREQVLRALDRAATRLRGKVGELLVTIQKFATPIEQATTPSLDALEAYSLGRLNMTNGDPAAAAALFRRAIRLDPNFAMAYASLGNDYSKLGRSEVAAQNAKKAYELRERTSQREKFYIESHYYVLVTGNLKKAREVYELWAITYPRDPVPVANLGAVYRELGEPDKRLSQNLAALRLDADTSAYYGVADAYLSLNRLNDVRATADRARARKLDSYNLRLSLYWLAFLENNSAAMEQQLSWAMGKPGIEDQFLSMEALTAAYYGQMKKARQLWQRAIESATRCDEPEMAGAYQARSSLEEAEFGNSALSRRAVTAALLRDRDIDVLMAAAEALARAGDSSAAQKLAKDLVKEFPEDTRVTSVVLPIVTASIEMNRANPSKAIDALSEALPYELGSSNRLYSAYLRGIACLQLRKGREAELEFQKILSYPGIVLNEPIGALAHLQLARAYGIQGDTPKGRAEYQLFLTLWKNADLDLPILKEAKAEYAKLS